VDKGILLQDFIKTSQLSEGNPIFTLFGPNEELKIVGGSSQKQLIEAVHYSSPRVAVMRLISNLVWIIYLYVTTHFNGVSTQFLM
jgi:hypothetical protein